MLLIEPTPYSSLRATQALRRPDPPKELAHLYADRKEYLAKQSYSLDSLRFGMARALFDGVLSTALLLSGFLPWSWALCGRLAGPGRGTLQAVFWALGTAAVGAAASIPWSAARTFGLEARHGFNKTTPRTFAADLLKSVALALLLGPPLVAGLVWVLDLGGPWVGLYLWLFMLALTLVLLTIYPVLIAPLFNSFSPLPDGELK